MVATPAWPPRSTPRLHVDADLATSADIRLSGPQAHYLLNVMRLKAGAPVRLFDDRSGEWLATIAEATKRDLVLALDKRLAERETVPDLWLLAAPLKRGPFEWLIEKATELGVARILPVVTQRAVVDRINPDRLRATAIEAAEQCGRTALPSIASPVPLGRMLADWPPDRPLLFADETGGEPIAGVVRPGPAAILIGPEGGFTHQERDAIRGLPGALGVSLGPRILRAETAAAAAISVWMANAGDWR